MPCHEIVNPETGRVEGHLCQPNGKTKPIPRCRKKRWWCFKCRKRLLHTHMAFYPEQPSYYGPSFWWECPRCHGEHVLFPGREWIYDDA